MVFGFSKTSKSFSFVFYAEKIYIQLYLQVKTTFSINIGLLSFYCMKYHGKPPCVAVVLLEFRYTKLIPWKLHFLGLSIKIMFFSVHENEKYYSAQKLYCLFFKLLLVFILAWFFPIRNSFQPPFTNSSKKFIIKLQSTRCGHVCPTHNLTPCKLVKESANIMGLPLHYNIV